MWIYINLLFFHLTSKLRRFPISLLVESLSILRYVFSSDNIFSILFIISFVNTNRNVFFIRSTTLNVSIVSYIDQIKRRLQKYTNINLIYKKIGSPSVISESLRIRLNHDFKWNEVEILDNEPFYKKRLISEIVHIKKQKHGLNRQIDIEILLDFHIIYTIFTHIVNPISYSFPLHSFSP